MNYSTIAIALVILLPTLGLMTWLWIGLSRVNKDLRAFTGFEGIHFEIGSAETIPPNCAGSPPA